jgi:hypothetical protein
MVRVEFPLCPAFKLKLVGESAMEKSGGAAVIVRFKGGEVDWRKLPSKLM